MTLTNLDVHTNLWYPDPSNTAVLQYVSKPMDGVMRVVTGEGQKTRSVFRQRLSRVEMNRTRSSKTLKAT